MVNKLSTYPQPPGKNLYPPHESILGKYSQLCLCLDNSTRAAVAKVPSPWRRPRAASAIMPCSLDSDSSVLE